MMKRKSKKNTKRKNEFRYHAIIIIIGRKKKKINHPAYIWQARGNIYDYHSITHSNKVKGITLKPLRQNPNPLDKREAFYDVDSKADVKSNFGRKRKGWKLHPSDQQEIHENKK